MAVVSNGNQTILQWRDSSGAGAGYSGNKYGTSAPGWVKLVRSGNNFTSFYSSDGINWNTMESYTTTMTDPVYIGLALTSHSSGNLCTATFDNVAIPSRLFTWNGGSGSTNNWSDAANWGNNAIVTGVSLIFAGSARLSPNNDTNSGTTYGYIQFE